VTAGTAVSAAVVFTWLGMVLAISFLEAPLKFRAPGVTVQIGLGIGRLVFRALNAVEAVFGVVLIVTAAVAGGLTGGAVAAEAVAIAMLLAQLVLVRPRLNGRSDRVLAGEDAPRSRGHLAYVALEAIKVVALLVTGVLLLARLSSPSPGRSGRDRLGGKGTVARDDHQVAGGRADRETRVVGRFEDPEHVGDLVSGARCAGAAPADDDTAADVAAGQPDFQSVAHVAHAMGSSRSRGHRTASASIAASASCSPSSLSSRTRASMGPHPGRA